MRAVPIVTAPLLRCVRNACTLKGTSDAVRARDAAVVVILLVLAQKYGQAANALAYLAEIDAMARRSPPKLTVCARFSCDCIIISE